MTAAGIAASGGTRFITNTIIGRVGGPALLGLTQSALSLTQLLALLLPSSMGTAASKFVAQSRGAGRIHEAEAITLYLRRRSLAVATVIAGVAALVWRIFYSGSVWQLAAVACLALSFSTYTFARGLQYGTGQILRATLWEVVLACIGLVGVVSLAVMGRRDLSLILPMTLGFILYTIASWSPQRPQALDLAVRKEMRTFIVLGTAGTLVSAGFLQSTVLVAKATGGLHLAGEFAAALTLATPVTMVASSISLATFPAMAAAWARHDEAVLRRHLDEATHLLLVVMAGSLGTLAMLSPVLADLVWGGEFDDVQLILPLLLLAAFFSAVAVPSVNVLTSRSNRGMATSVGASTLGLMFGISIWVLLSIAGVEPTVFVPTGYVMGVVVQTGIPVGLAWSSHRRAWLLPFLRAGTWLALSGIFVAVERRYLLGWHITIGVAAAYALAWLAWHRVDLVGAVRLVRSGPRVSGEESVS